jgi:AcrR family transcriptional regulator
MVVSAGRPTSAARKAEKRAVKTGSERDGLRSRKPMMGNSDERRSRTVRTRQRLITSFLELLRESPEIPTAAQVAKRAGCSRQSSCEHFSSILDLSVAVAEYAFVQGSQQAVARHVDGDRQTRLRSQVEARARTCEDWLPLWRALLHYQRKSDKLRVWVARVHDATLQRLELMYKPELSKLADGERVDVLIALGALTDFESWGRMRELHGLSIKEAQDVWIKAIDRMLPPTP